MSDLMKQFLNRGRVAQAAVDKLIDNRSPLEKECAILHFQRNLLLTAAKAATDYLQIAQPNKYHRGAVCQKVIEQLEAAIATVKS